jgi:hypothetical protein
MTRAFPAHKRVDRLSNQVAAMRVKIATVVGLVLFCILSLADLGLTWKLIRHGDGRVYESNPVARAWLTAYDWQGLVGFKVATMLILAAVVLLLVRYRPKAGLLLVIFSCVAVGWVVLYSYRLVPHALR